MADREYKCVVVTPAGRRCYLEILAKHLAKQTHSFEEWHLWQNTSNGDDIACMNELASQYSWVKVIQVPNSDPGAGNFNIHRFFDTTRDPNTIYIRLDDDIVWLDDNFIADMYQARIDNPSYFLVYPNIVNNGITCHLHQRTGAFKYDGVFIEYACMGNAWSDPKISVALHHQFLDSVEQGDVEKWRNCFKQWIALIHERISINSFAFFGKTFANIHVGHDEEDWLSCVYPRDHKMCNLIVGSPMCVHYAFYTQRPSVNEDPNILLRYKAIAEK